MKIALKVHHKRIDNVLRNKRISSKKAKVERVYVVTKKIFKVEKVLVTAVQRMILKILYSFLS